MIIIGIFLFIAAFFVALTSVLLAYSLYKEYSFIKTNFINKFN